MTTEKHDFASKDARCQSLALKFPASKGVEVCQMVCNLVTEKLVL